MDEKKTRFLRLVIIRPVILFLELSQIHVFKIYILSCWKTREMCCFWCGDGTRDDDGWNHI